MRLVPHEIDKLLLYQVGSLSQRRLCRGIKLNRSEAVGLISFVLLELIRDGKHSVSELMQIGRNILGKKHVIESIVGSLDHVQVEGMFQDGTFLVTIHEPFSTIDGNIELALYGSFLPIPNDDLFQISTLKSDPKNCSLATAGATELLDSPIELCPLRKRIFLNVNNLGDRAIQVGSHYHFSETNSMLQFDRLKAMGMRLDIPAGTSVRFEPGDEKLVQLVDIGGNKRITGGNNFCNIKMCDFDEKILSSFKLSEFSHMTDKCDYSENPLPPKIDRITYASMFGVTVGDQIQLGDSNIWIEVEKDYTVYGDECKFGGGKVLREGMGQISNYENKEVVDLLITNALILDYTGIYKADIGIKNGIIVKIGKGGNPDMMDSVDILCGAETEVLAAEKNIITAGGIDTHIHFICPQICDEAIASGLTTLIGGGTGPNTGTNATTCTPGAYNLHMMMLATDSIPMNFGFTGKGNSSSTIELEKQILAGAIGLKLHEDWGTTPEAIDKCLSICDKYDVQATIHTDTLNESGFVDDTIKAFKNRTIHTYHTEGAGGGHAPDILKVCEYDYVLPSSTNPTRPFTTNTLDEHVDMLMVCHHLDPKISEDIAFAESRIRAETIAAEDILQDMGAISIISSDSQAMGRIGEVISRTWKTAHKMKAQRGVLKPDGLDSTPENNLADNYRAKRYIAKYTINPAIAHGVSHIIGSIEEGKMADLVMYKPELFGAKPEIVIKGGQIVYAQMGDANASIPTTQPVIGRKMYGYYSDSSSFNSLLFVSGASLDSKAVLEKYNINNNTVQTKKKRVAVVNCRRIKKKDMKFNSYCPSMKVDPETYEVWADGKLCTCEPAGMSVGLHLPMNQVDFMF